MPGRGFLYIDRLRSPAEPTPLQRSPTHHAKRLTEGSIVRSLIALSVPIVFANVLQTAYQLVDTFWVGRLGANAVAAVSLSFPITFLMISMRFATRCYVVIPTSDPQEMRCCVY